MNARERARCEDLATLPPCHLITFHMSSMDVQNFLSHERTLVKSLTLPIMLPSLLVLDTTAHRHVKLA